MSSKKVKSLADKIVEYWTDNPKIFDNAKHMTSGRLVVSLSNIRGTRLSGLPIPRWSMYLCWTGPGDDKTRYSHLVGVGRSAHIIQLFERGSVDLKDLPVEKLARFKDHRHGAASMVSQICAYGRIFEDAPSAYFFPSSIILFNEPMGVASSESWATVKKIITTYEHEYEAAIAALDNGDFMKAAEEAEVMDVTEEVEDDEDTEGLTLLQALRSSEVSANAELN